MIPLPRTQSHKVTKSWCLQTPWILFWAKFKRVSPPELMALSHLGKRVGSQLLTWFLRRGNTAWSWTTTTSTQRTHTYREEPLYQVVEL